MDLSLEEVNSSVMTQDLVFLFVDIDTVLGAINQLKPEKSLMGNLCCRTTSCTHHPFWLPSLLNFLLLYSSIDMQLFVSKTL